MKTFVEISGWAGTILILLAYFLLSRSYIDAQSVPYQLMNLIGVIGVGFQVWYKRSWSALALQIIWGMIALWSLFGILNIW